MVVLAILVVAASVDVICVAKLPTPLHTIIQPREIGLLLADGSVDALINRV
jgi:hypothetical protein